MKKIYIGAMAIGSLLATSCAKDNLNTTSEDPGGSTSAQNTEEVGGLTLKAEIQTWQEDQSLRALGWDIADASATNDGLVPKVKYTQQEFSGEFAPGEDPATGKTTRYYIGDNRIDPQYTEVSIKIRRPYRNLAGTIQGTPTQLRYTVWDTRNYNSGIKGGLGKVEVSEGVDGKQNIEVYLPMAKQTVGLFDGDWFMAVALGGHAGGYTHEEGMYQYFTPSANGTISTLIPGIPIPNAHVQSGSTGKYEGNNKFANTVTNFGWHPALTEPNRYEFPAKTDAASFFGGLAAGTNPSTVTLLRRGLGLKEQTGSVSGMKRHFPMMSRFYKISASKRNEYSAVGNNKTNYGQVASMLIEPRGTILAFKVKNTLDKPIRVQSVTGNHGGTFDYVQATHNTSNGAVTITPRSYKAISYQGFYVSGFATRNRTANNAASTVTTEGMATGGFPEADMMAGQKIPFVGLSTGPEEFPLVTQDGTQGIVLQPGQETTGRFYLWFSADPGAEFKIRMKYDELDANNTATSSGNLSKPQKVNPARGINFEEGKVYGALISVKPN